MPHQNLPEEQGRRLTDPEEGSVLIIALIMIVLLTIIGISASKTSEIEIMIAGNERVAKENFYLAEGSVRRSVMILENTDLKNSAPYWLLTDDVPGDGLTEFKTGGSTLPASVGAANILAVEDQISGATNWTDTFSQSLADMNGDARCIALKKGLAGQTSAKATGPLPYDHVVYGKSDYKGGLGLVAVGYRKAY